MNELLERMVRGGCAVQFTYEPADGYLAMVDVFGEGGVVATHEGIAGTAEGALAAAAEGMAMHAAGAR